ncbi:hypothetical protein RV18_GL001414 [Enterococcus termitis]|nr:hypothetical protein RV18_GL001414 [Enterococcus termitis]
MIFHRTHYLKKSYLKKLKEIHEKIFFVNFSFYQKNPFFC